MPDDLTAVNTHGGQTAKPVTTTRASSLFVLLALLLALAGTALAAGQEQAAPSAAYTAVVLEAAPLTNPHGAELGTASPGQALEVVGQEAGRLLVRLPGGQEAWLPAASAAVFAGAPAEHAPRLARLAAANVTQPLRQRLLAGRIAPGDSQWQVELAWGRPWRSFMVNLFRDEEHYVYRAPGGASLLLRFKGGRLEALPERETLAVESSPPPR
ncbi:MAG: hypothetical protein HY910_14610 [Desulfarculus sp.]|nr:hypothetical protein [Desulfarculus sp.]